ncbi:PP-loop family-domain-containing protein [Aspergillus karnatakaensis]|uniref:tRNA lysidine(34) synthetase n=1 Tax=Aspergillus karnatakaensis TaxID=1810916 RepID=UPI003CCCD215
MAVPCVLRSTGAGAITVPQFTDLLQRTWLESRRFRQGRATSGLPRRLGLAISGGADSMALAYLCRQWEKQTQSHIQGQAQSQDEHEKISITAFVVDHKARKESTDEANTVAGWLREMGLKTCILPLEWPDLSISAFETHARRLRFQALGKACRDSRIEALLLGHHQDDNVETTIWRLSSGARGAGLAGIPAVARIPECHGLFGVSESGEGVTLRSDEFLDSKNRNRDQYRQPQQTRAPFEISAGGILLCRPLLSLPKSDLVATCNENNVPFVTDPTNFDPTLTPRNAIRHLASSGSLPRALQNPSILSLIKKSQDLIRESHSLSDGILSNQFKLLDLSLTSGSVTLQVNDGISSSSSHKVNNSEEEGQKKLSPQRLLELQALSLRRITELVSPFPENQFALSSYAKFTDRIFSTALSSYKQLNARLGPSTGPKREEAGDRKPFTLGGVLFQPLPYTSKTTPSSETEQGIKATTGSKWLLTRQPFMRHREPILRFDLPLNSTMSAQQTATPLTPWTLWDNRFWIRFQAQFSADPNSEVHAPDLASSSERTFLLRPLKQSDLTALRTLLKMKNSQGNCKQPPPLPQSSFSADSLFEKLNLEAPGQSRFTIPVIALADEADSGDIPLALPTLDLAFLGTRAWRIMWEWKYKMVDLEALKLMVSM